MKGGDVGAVTVLWAVAALGIALMATTWTEYEVNAAVVCPSGFLSCYDGECLRQAKFCDGHQDCKDGSDEHDCDAPCHPPDYFRCNNGKCVSHVFVCDGEDECGDGSDEHDCQQKPSAQPSSCKSDEFKCADGLCVPAHWRCDGQKDCLDGSDETIGCTAQLDCTEKGLFMCANHHCIPSEWRCDGVDDCLDNSDEQGCAHMVDGGNPGEHCPVERGLYPCKDGTSCAELSELCNDVTDCPDGSDEGPNCNNSKRECTSYGCAHRCIPTPKGPLCVCPKGFFKSAEQYCKDINECEEYGICSQQCKNTPGSYKCLCESWYELQPDNKSCRALGPDPLLVFSMKTEVRALQLRTKVYFSVAKDQQHIAGVDYDGIHMYWTTIVHGEEAIVKSEEDGSHQEIVVSSGLSLPEDLAVDWLTENIYFTDSEMKHIGVCSNDGKHCTALVNEDLDSPRAIQLDVPEAFMYWTDWGRKPMIARAGMDGSSPVPFVSENLQWPAGLALDLPNGRIYWVDAKLAVIESIKLDGTDRRIVLGEVIKHPFALAIFEDNLYWSDFKTSEIQACHKFTGKNVQKIVHSRNNYFYGLHVYHPSLHPENVTNLCQDVQCSDICLLAPNKSYSCACAENKLLNEDKHTCTEIHKKEELVIGAGNKLVIYTYQSFGKSDVARATLKGLGKIGSFAYDKVQELLFISDTEKRQIKTLNMQTNTLSSLITDGIGNVLGLDFDYMGNNLYWCDAEKETIEVMSMTTKRRKTLLRTHGQELPLDIVVVPENAIMFIAFKNQATSNNFHIDKMNMDGTGGIIHLMEHNLVGPKIALAYDRQLKQLFILDSGRASIEACELDGSNHHGIQSLASSPISITTLGNELFWTTTGTSNFHWANKIEEFGKVKHFTLDMFEDEHLILQSLPSTEVVPDHKCRKENGGCSDLCLASSKTGICTCADDYVLQSDNKTCETQKHCGITQYKCEKENRCIPILLRCDGNPDCASGEDEINCPTPCLPGQFECDNGQCVNFGQKCDDLKKCKDGFNCPQDFCTEDQFTCFSGECINQEWKCDFKKDCEDGSDEENCGDETCPTGKFRCRSGNCIPASWECDHEINCPDGSDEHDSCPPQICHPDDFMCSNTRCIDMKLKCDGQDDCGDDSDEIDCTQNSDFSIPITCAQNEFKCTKPLNLCLPEQVRCNGSAECPKGEDELGCGCSFRQFECDGNKCIDERWVCDGVFDCDDKTDEEIKLCGQKMDMEGPCLGYRCNSGQCLDLIKVCDGIPQCHDHSDEGEKCISACNRGNPCEGVCNPTPSGPICSCHPGYSMRAESTICVDIDECAQNICSQICLNSEGSYTCSCAQGYSLRLDRTSCKAEGEPMQILFIANSQEIRLAPFSLKSIKILHQNSATSIVDLSVDVHDKQIYWTTAKGEIFVKSLNDKTTKSISNLGHPGKMSVDWITDNVYFSDFDDNSYSIKVCNFKFKKCAKIIKAETGSEITNLIVDPHIGYIFWTERQENFLDGPKELIKRAEMSGSTPIVLVQGLSTVAGLTIDFIHKMVFWLDSKESIIGAIHYDGEGRRVVFNRRLVYDAGLAFFEDSLYWLSTETGKLTKCKVFGEPKHCDWIQLNSHSIQNFVLMQEQLQKIGVNGCLDKVCSHMCVSSARDPQCICPDGSPEQGSECGVPKETRSAEPNFSSDKAGFSVSLFITIVLVLLIIVFAALYIILVLRKKITFTTPRSVTSGVRYISNAYTTFTKGPSSAHAVWQKPADEMEEVPRPQLNRQGSTGSLQFPMTDINGDDEPEISVKDTARLIP